MRRRKKNNNDAAETYDLAFGDHLIIFLVKLIVLLLKFMDSGQEQLALLLGLLELFSLPHPFLVWVSMQEG